MNGTLTQIVVDTARTVPDILPYLSEGARLFVQLRTRKATEGGDIGAINKAYHDAITRAMVDYFEGGSVAPSRNAFKKAMIQAFGDSFDLGWTQGGAELPVDDDAIGWLEARLNQEAGYIDVLFQQAKEVRKEEDADYFAWLTSHADNYTSTVSAVYNAGRMYAKKNQMLEWRLGNTERHCATCSKLSGKRHKASWYLSRNHIPRQPGANLQCGGYNCDCSLVDPEGNEVTI
jgi:hypothetical protein